MKSFNTLFSCCHVLLMVVVTLTLQSCIGFWKAEIEIPDPPAEARPLPANFLDKNDISISPNSVESGGWVGSGGVSTYYQLSAFLGLPYFGTINEHYALISIDGTANLRLKVATGEYKLVGFPVLDTLTRFILLKTSLDPFSSYQLTTEEKLQIFTNYYHDESVTGRFRWYQVAQDYYDFEIEPIVNRNPVRALRYLRQLDHEPLWMVAVEDFGAKFKLGIQDNDGNPLLILLVQREHFKAVQKLIRYDVNLESENRHGETALVVASKRGYLQTVNSLLANGANPKVKANHEPIFIWAIRHQKLEIAKSLLKNGADVEAQNKDGDTALMLASRQGHKEVVEFLLDRGAKIEAQNEYGNTALMIASEEVQKEVVELLLDRGANPNVQNEAGDTALILASQSSRHHEEVVELLEIALNEARIHLFSKEQVFWVTSAFKMFPVKSLSSQTSDWKHNKQTPALESITTYANRLIQSQHNKLKSVYQRVADYQIPKPQVPEAIQLKQDEWETNTEFEARVRQITAQRQAKVDKIQEAYRQLVEDRNTKLKKAYQTYQKDLDALPTKAIVAKATNDVIASLQIQQPTMNKDTGDMFVTLQSTQSDYQQPLKVSGLSLSLRKTLFQDPQRFKVKAQFAIADDNSLQLKQVKLQYQDQQFQAQATDETHQQTNALVAAVGGQETIQNLPELTLQNPNLKVDLVDQIFYKDGSKYQDDLLPKLQNLAKADKNPKVWVFAIGIEKYLQADDIIYAKRSAELFTETIVKQQGVTEGRTILLTDDKATRGLITDKMKFLKQEVEEGDIIYFYYNGHGVPLGENKDEPYILPSDSIPDYVEDYPEFKLAHFYKALTDTKASKVIAFVDSCFTGKTDGKLVFKGKAPLMKTPKKVNFDQEKMVILTAGTENQFSSAYWEKGHRLFTYFVIQELLQPEPQDVDHLYKRVYAQVSGLTKDKGASRQNPVLMGNPSLTFSTQ